MKIALTKNKKNIIKGITLFVFVAVISNFINMSLIKVKADVPTQPSFEVKLNSATPSPALVGEDITINGTITPKDFQAGVKSQKKEIVLVLDVSGSMNAPVKIKCTNQRVTHKVESGYWTYSGWWPFRYKDKWIDTSYSIPDYCEEHGEAGEHEINSTKMAELKKAANSFIDKISMSGISDLKISIVAYSSEATINPSLTHYNYDKYRLYNYSNHNYDYYNYDIKKSSSVDLDNSNDYVPNYKSSGSDFLDASSSTNITNLKGMINGLEALGGTNTGEGLRQAEYMLEHGESDANKSIVFMSDGLPTFYSVQGNNNKAYYTTIDNTNPTYGGYGNSDSDGKCKQYAKEIGAIIKDNKRNVFSVGYGLGNEQSDGNKTMNVIHNFMGGISDNKHFFATDAGAVDGVFSGIADEIIKSYTVDSLAMNINFNSADGFSLNIAGNTVKLNNIVYNKVDNSEIDGKWTYKADPVPFSFVIKGSKPGVYNNIFKDSTATFPWEGNPVTGSVVQNGLTITIKDNELPNIKANFESATPNPANNLNQEITLNYGINPESFNFANNIEDSGTKDVVILLDNSHVMGDSKLGKIKDNLFNKILNDSTLKTQETAYSLVTYNKDATIMSGFVKSEAEITNLNNNILKSIGLEGGSRNIVGAFDKAESLLSGGRSNAKKYIILISSGKASGSIKDIDAKIDEVKNKYNLISLDLSNVTSANIDDILYSDDNNESNDNNHLIKYIHLKSGGQKDDYFINKNYEKNATNPCLNDDNNIGNSILPAIAERLIGGAKSKYTVSDIKLNFNLGGNFEAIPNSNSNLIKSMNSINDEKLELTLCTIEYRLDNSGKYVAWYEDSNGQYKTWGSDENLFEISFRIKPNKYGTLGFGTPNAISYSSLLGNLITKPIETPTVTVRGVEDVVHGLYNGMNDDYAIPNIDTDTTGSKNFIEGTNVRLGATFKVYSNKSIANLNALRGNSDGAVNVYKIANGQLNLIGTMTKLEGNNYTFPFKDIVISPNGDNILIVYNETLPPVSANPYSNIMDVDGVKGIVKLHVVSDKLPDLF